MRWHTLAHIMTVTGDMPSVISGCLAQVGERHKGIYWMPVMVFESVIVALAAAKVIKVYRDKEAAPHVLAVILRDSVIYFGGVLVLVVTNVIIWEVARVSASRAAHALSLTDIVSGICVHRGHGVSAP